MAKKLLSFEGIVFYDAPGAADPANQILVLRDSAYGIDPTLADTSDRGDSSSVPYAEADVAQLGHTIELEINNKDTDPFVAAVRAAANSGAPLAFKTRDKANGYGVIGDYVVGVAENQSLTDAQRLNVTCTPTSNQDRKPVWGTG